MFRTIRYLGLAPTVIETVSDNTERNLTDLLGQQQTQNHPELNDVFFIDKINNTRISPNGTAIDIDNDTIHGKLLIWLRTSDADQKVEPSITGGTASNDQVSNYFRGKKRRLAVQLQIKFKKVPDSRLYFGMDYENPHKLGGIKSAFLKATLNFIKMKNPTFSYALSGKENASEDDIRQGRYENPHFAFPIESSVNNIVITKAGDVPPKLGKECYEDSNEKKLKRRNGIVYNTRDTYTFTLWDAHADLVKYKAVNLPAIPQFSLASVNGGQHFSIKLYTMDATRGKHLQCNIDPLFDIEYNKRKATSFGDGARRWMDKHKEDEDLSEMFHDAFSHHDGISQCPTEPDVDDNEFDEKTGCCNFGCTIS